MLAQMIIRKPANRYLAALLLLCRKRIMFGNALQKLMGTVYIIYGVSALPIQTPELQVNCLEISEAILEPG
jgi:hypothetical protein